MPEEKEDLTPSETAPAFEDRALKVDLDKTPEVDQVIETETEGEVALEMPATVGPGASEVDKPEDTKATEDKPFQTFETEQEFNDRVELEARRQIEKTKETVEQEKKEKPEPIELYKGHFDEKEGKWVGDSPRDWNEFGNKILETITPRVTEAVRNMTSSEKDEISKINAEFDSEYNAIAQSGKLPSLESTEGQEANKAISKMGATYNQDSFTKSYELWSKMPKDQGGGLDYSTKNTEVAKNKVVQQKKASGLVGGSKATPAPSTKHTPYDVLHNQSLDDLVDEQLE